MYPSLLLLVHLILKLWHGVTITWQLLIFARISQCASGWCWPIRNLYWMHVKWWTRWQSDWVLGWFLIHPFPFLRNMLSFHFTMLGTTFPFICVHWQEHCLAWRVAENMLWWVHGMFRQHVTQLSWHVGKAPKCWWWLEHSNFPGTSDFTMDNKLAVGHHRSSWSLLGT